MTEIQNLLNSLPVPAELKRRAHISAYLQPILTSMFKPSELYQTKTEPDDVEVTTTHWDDGGGQSLTLIFKDNLTLLLAYDHEISTNFYDDEPDKQMQLYNGVPVELMKEVRNVDEDYWNLNITTADGGTILSASAVAWHDGNSWSYAPEFDELREGEDGGLKYCLSNLLPNTDFTLTHLMEHVTEHGWDDTPELRQKLQKALNEN